MDLEKYADLCSQTEADMHYDLRWPTLPYTTGLLDGPRSSLSLSTEGFNLGETPSRQSFKNNPLQNLIQENDFHQELLGTEAKPRMGSIWSCRWQKSLLYLFTG